MTDALAGLLPSARLHILPGGHTSHMTSMESFLAELEGFLRVAHRLWEGDKNGSARPLHLPRGEFAAIAAGGGTYLRELRPTAPNRGPSLQRFSIERG